MVSGSLVLYFDTDLSFLPCFRAAKKTLNAKPFNMVVEFRIDPVEGTRYARYVTKTIPRIAYCFELIAIGCLGHPGELFSLIFIGFH